MPKVGNFFGSWEIFGKSYQNPGIFGVDFWMKKIKSDKLFWTAKFGMGQSVVFSDRTRIFNHIETQRSRF